MASHGRRRRCTPDADGWVAHRRPLPASIAGCPDLVTGVLGVAEQAAGGDDGGVVTIADIVAAPPGEGQVVDPRLWFAAPGPLEVEIGCGKGGFLLHRARTQPHVCLLGIEWANKYFRFCADRMARWQLANVRVMRTDAREFVVHHLQAECVTTLHLYHPDPWPKKRHHKRRLVQAPFVAAVARVLAAGGRWRIQTDHEDYFQSIREVVEQEPRLHPVPWDDDPTLVEEGWSGTNFEIKYLRDGRAIHRVAYEKRRQEPFSGATGAV
ncbi:MAG TPA: tRNA (guanosine(46)-N7)-methyltransferase TrmB [Phycisphaerae bacterium]|nr:tRNA (guanosine(46)-N7)-methyltransferase TrmB [Phycisphaerae bacterium]HNU43714.1 tRNA (guanosine(46)-N7)-methyltransferase TrmB [Phycisphaerae bacterium]